jgi:hypothetical protein
MLDYLTMQNLSYHGYMNQVTQQKLHTVRTKLYSNDNFIYLCLFNDAFCSSDYTASNDKVDLWMMN